ncbi:hypothetical protein LTR95_003307 [Oleoguttula sp. CCFEE 5521]
MADPLSIAASVIAIATVFLQSSKALTEFVRDIKGAPEELRAVASDTKTFSAQVLAVKKSLAMPAMARLVDDTEVIRESMLVMHDAMQNYVEACDVLMKKLDAHSTSAGSGVKLYGNMMHAVLQASGNASVVQIDRATIASASSNVASSLLSYAASVAAGPDSISARSYRLAVEAADFDLMEKLLDQGVSVDTVFHEGHTALIQAVMREDLAMAQLLLDHGADPHAVSHEGRTALLQAVANKDLVMVQLLLDRGANPSTDKSSALTTERRQMDATELMRRTSTDRNSEEQQQDESGDSVLHLAMRAWQSADECYSIVLTLLEYSANVNATNTSGDTPLSLLLREAAGKEGCDRVVRLLINRGASSNCRNSAGDTPLSYTLCGQYPWDEFNQRNRFGTIAFGNGS